MFHFKMKIIEPKWFKILRRLEYKNHLFIIIIVIFIFYFDLALCSPVINFTVHLTPNKQKRQRIQKKVYKYKNQERTKM